MAVIRTFLHHRDSAVNLENAILVAQDTEEAASKASEHLYRVRRYYSALEACEIWEVRARQNMDRGWIWNALTVEETRIASWAVQVCVPDSALFVETREYVEAVNAVAKLPEPAEPTPDDDLFCQKVLDGLAALDAELDARLSIAAAVPLPREEPEPPPEPDPEPVSSNPEDDEDRLNAWEDMIAEVTLSRIGRGDEDTEIERRMWKILRAVDSFMADHDDGRPMNPDALVINALCYYLNRAHVTNLAKTDFGINKYLLDLADRLESRGYETRANHLRVKLLGKR